MYVSYCILFCLAAFTLVCCRKDEDRTCEAIKSCLDKNYYLNNGLSQCKSTLRQCQESETLLKSQLQGISNVLFHPALVYKNKKYLISKFAHKDVADAMAHCVALGGYLAEPNDVNEYKAMQGLVVSLPEILVVIGGSDAAVEGTYIFPRTGQPVTTIEWAQNQPDEQQEAEDCLSLWKTYEGKFNDLTCGIRSADDRFMCEIPNNF